MIDVICRKFISEMDELITVVLSLFFGLASFYAIYSIFLYVYQSGIFWNIDVSMQTRHVLSSRKIIAYKVYRGDYAKIYQTFAPIMRLAPYSDTIGIYYDNSGTVRISTCYWILQQSLPSGTEYRIISPSKLCSYIT